MWSLRPSRRHPPLISPTSNGRDPFDSSWFRVIAMTPLGIVGAIWLADEGDAADPVRLMLFGPEARWSGVTAARSRAAAARTHVPVLGAATRQYRDIHGRPGGAGERSVLGRAPGWQYLGTVTLLLPEHPEYGSRLAAEFPLPEFTPAPPPASEATLRDRSGVARTFGSSGHRRTHRSWKRAGDGGASGHAGARRGMRDRSRRGGRVAGARHLRRPWFADTGLGVTAG